MLFLTHIWTVVCSPNSLPSADPLALVYAQRPGLSEACHSGGCSSGTGLGEHTFAKSLGHDFQKGTTERKDLVVCQLDSHTDVRAQLGKAAFSLSVWFSFIVKKKNQQHSLEISFPFLSSQKTVWLLVAPSSVFFPIFSPGTPLCSVLTHLPACFPSSVYPAWDLHGSVRTNPPTASLSNTSLLQLPSPISPSCPLSFLPHGWGLLSWTLTSWSIT